MLRGAVAVPGLVMNIIQRLAATVDDTIGLSVYLPLNVVFGVFAILLLFTHVTWWVCLLWTVPFVVIYLIFSLTSPRDILRSAQSFVLLSLPQLSYILALSLLHSPSP